MTAKEAREIIKYYKLIQRANKVGFPIPEKWAKYGNLMPNDLTGIMKIYMTSASDIFERDDVFYKAMKRK